MRTGPSLGLWLALVLYAALAFFTVRAVAPVGEVDIGWALATPPKVLVQWAPPVESAANGALGPLEARQTRPLESLVLGPARIPLAINAYTGGAADWPARLARALTGLRGAGVATNVALGALLLALAHRFLRFHGTPTSSGAAALLLATDWSFVFFKKVLGGTELLLQVAGLLVIWALWSRRWKGGRHGTAAIALGVGLGLGAKATFAGTLLAFGAAALLTRRDRPAVNPPAPVHLGWLVAVPLLCVSPLVLSFGHHALLGDVPRIVSHDTLGLQSGRLLSGGHLGREAAANVGRFFGNPLAWLADAWGTVPVEPLAPLRLVTLALGAAGALMEWRHRTRSPSAALLRYLSLAVPMQGAVLFLLNRDLHHLAQATVPLALLVALGADRVAAEYTRPRSPGRAVLLAVLVAPAMAAGVGQLLATDGVVRTARARTFTADGQAALVDLLRTHGVTRLVVNDYELYGAIEELAPEIAVTHGWGAVSRKDRDLAGLRAAAKGGYYLIVRPSAPFIYDWSAPDVGVRVGELSDGSGNWAELRRVE
jgi:hypothetical protein